MDGLGLGISAIQCFGPDQCRRRRRSPADAAWSGRDAFYWHTFVRRKRRDVANRPALPVPDPHFTGKPSFPDQPGERFASRGDQKKLPARRSIDVTEKIRLTEKCLSARD